MLTRKTIIACLTLLLGGCMFIPSPYSEQLKPVVERYSAIKPRMTRSELEARLGKPTREEADGLCVWETRFDDVNYAMLKVWFDPAAKAQKVELTRAHGKVVPGYSATAVTTFSK